MPELKGEALRRRLKSAKNCLLYEIRIKFGKGTINLKQKRMYSNDKTHYLQYEPPNGRNGSDGAVRFYGN